MNEPQTFIGQLFWDAKLQTYSASRMTMFGSFVMSGAAFVLTCYIILDSYMHGKPLPDLSWFVYGGTGSAGIGTASYIASRWSSSGDPMPFNDEPQNLLNDPTATPEEPEGEEAE